MARPGERLFNPVTGTRIVFVATPGETGGRAMAIDWHVPPGEMLPAAPHYHAGPDGGVAECFEVLAGTAACRVGSRKLTVRAPDVVAVGFNQVHTHPVNVGEDALHVRQIGERDAPEPEMMMRVERFIETLVALSQQGGVDRKGNIRNPLQAALSINDLLLDPTFLPVAPRGLQRVMFGWLAALARSRGYRAYHRPEPEAGPPPGSPE